MYRAATRGMTLVEVTICLGLVSFGLISVLGLLPTGLITLRDARDASARSSYLQTISAEYLSLSFADVPSSNTFFFDRDGQPVDSSSSSQLYKVAVESLTPVYPNQPTGVENRLRRLRVTSWQLNSAGVTNGRAPHIQALQIADGGF